MKGFPLYLDEDASCSDLARALRARGVEVTTVLEEGKKRRADVEQLVWAAQAGRVIYSFNSRDFCRLHREFTAVGREHAGIIVALQQTYSIGEQLRRLLNILTAKSQFEMRNEIEFLSNWR